MKRLGFVLLVLTACRGNKEPSPTLGAKPLSDGTACPIPKGKDVRERFAVGAIPSYRVNSLSGEAAECHDEFVENDVVKTEGTHSRIVAEGMFGGHCPGKPTKWPRVFEAVKPAKAVVEITALAINDDTGLGLGKPVVLDSATPDKMAGVTARVVDRCGEKLEATSSGNVVTWTPAASCENVAKIMPYDHEQTPGKEKAQTMRVAAIAAGTCTIGFEFLGVKGEVPVTVK